MSALPPLQFIFKKDDLGDDRRFNDEFEKCIKNRRNDKVKYILRNILTRIPVKNLVDIHGKTLLHLAAKYNNSELIDFLINAGCDVNAKDSFGNTALLTAFFCRQRSAVEVLLGMGAEISINDAKTVLHTLIKKKFDLSPSMEMVLMQSFKKCGEDIDTMACLLLKVNCPLKMVVYVGDAHLTQKMLEAPDYKIDLEYDTDLSVWHAMETGDLENLRVLWQSERILGQKRVDLLNRLLVKICMSALHRQMFKPALKQLDKWIVYDSDFIKFLCQAFNTANKYAVDLLLQKCDVDVQIRQKYKFDVLPIIFGNNNLDDEDIIELACKRQFDVNATCYYGWTALHFALTRQSQATVRFLLELGAACNIKNNLGFTCFSLIEDAQCCQIILQNSMNLRIGENYESVVFDSISYSVSDDLRETLLAQLAIESYQGVEIKKRIIRAINCDPEFRNYYEMCLQQVKQLVNCEIVPSLTLFTVLTAKPEKLLLHTQNDETVSKIIQCCLQQSLNPFYSSSLKFNLDKACYVYRSKCQVAAIISKITSTPINFDHLIIDRIFYFLVYRDIITLACT